MLPTYEQISRAWRRASRGKTALARYQRYRYYLDDHICAISDELSRPDFAPLAMGVKQIYRPKPRTAQVPSVRDKIIMHALCDNYVYPAVAERLGDCASACLIGRGTEYGTRRATALMRGFWREHHGVPWVLKGDVHAYFASVSRERVAELAGLVLPDDDILRISKAYIFCDGARTGMPLGLQQSQCYGNLYLSAIDELVAEHGYTAYGRHMDDFYALAPTRDELADLLREIEAKLCEIGLELNPKTEITHGRLDFLGFTHVLTPGGKYVLRLQDGKKRAKKQEIKMIVRKLEAGELTPEQVQTRYQGWRQRALRAGCRNAVVEMDRCLVLRLQKAGYRTRTTMKGVSIIGKKN